MCLGYLTMTFSRGHLEQAADRDESLDPDFPPFFAAGSEMFFASWQKISGADGLPVKRLDLSPIIFFYNSISFDLVISERPNILLPSFLLSLQ